MASPNQPKQLVECPCGCKHLETEDMVKRHFSILALLVFVVTLGLVALNSYQRDRMEKSSQRTIAQSMGPGATQAAEAEFPTITPTQQYGGYQTYEPTPVHPQYIYQYQANADLIRHEQPSFSMVATGGLDGKTRVKRIVRK